MCIKARSVHISHSTNGLKHTDFHTSFSVGSPGVLFLFFLFMTMFELVSSQKLKIWYFFVYLFIYAFSSISHGWKAVGAAFLIMCCSCVYWCSVWGESVQTFTEDWGMRFHQRPPQSHRIATILNEAFTCWFTISAIGRADCLNMMCKILISEYEWGFS